MPWWYVWSPLPMKTSPAHEGMKTIDQPLNGFRGIADALRAVNRDRPRRERILLSVDGVHGFGVEAATPKELGCDFLISGCHKCSAHPSYPYKPEKPCGHAISRSDWAVRTIHVEREAANRPAGILDADAGGPLTIPVKW